MNSESQKKEPMHWGLFAVGIFLLIVAFAFAAWGFHLGTLTEQQQRILVWILSLASGFAAGSFAGSFSVQTRNFLGILAIGATSGFAVWFLTFFYLFPTPATHTGPIYPPDQTLDVTNTNALSQFLAEHDPSVFSWAKDGHYKIARVLVNRDDLEENTSISDTLAKTQATFDLLATSAQVFQTHEDDFENAIERGVNIRVLLQERNPATASFYGYHSDTPDVGDTTSNLIGQIQGKIDKNRDLYKGSIELRWLKRPMLYSLWLKDAGIKAAAVGHVCVFSFRHGDHDMCFRAGQDCPELIDSLRVDFQKIWDDTAPSAAPDAPGGDALIKPSMAPVRELLTICWRRSVFTRTHAEFSHPAMFSSIDDCRAKLEVIVPTIPSPLLQGQAADVLGCLDAIMHLQQPEDPAKIDQEKLEIIRNLRALARETGSGYAIPQNLTEELFFTRKDADAPPMLKAD